MVRARADYSDHPDTQPPLVRKFGRSLPGGVAQGRRRSNWARESASSTALHCRQFERARELGRAGVCGVAFPNFFHHFGFSEAWREPGDEARYPPGKVMLPASEGTIERHGAAQFRLCRHR